MVSVTITGVPLDASLSAGTNNGGGSWTLIPGQLAGLTLTAGAATTASLTVTATNTEGATASTSQTIPLTVTSDPPKLITSAFEPVSYFVGIALVTPSDKSDTVSLTIAGLPTGATLSAGDINGNVLATNAAGTHNPDGSWTLTEKSSVFSGPFYGFTRW